MAYVVLGATGGIGTAVVRQLFARAAQVVVAGSDADRVGALAAEGDAVPVVLDAREPAEVQGAVDAAVESFGRVEGVVNCVGSLLLKPAHATSEEEWDEVMAVNLRSAFGAVKAAAKAMRKTGGSVVLVSSAAARVGLANHEAIAAAKAGVIGLTLAAAATYAPKGLRVNAVAPGLVRTPLTKGVAGDASEKMHALGRLGEPADVASLIVWLLDPANAWVTGQVFGVDGGLATVRPR